MNVYRDESTINLSKAAMDVQVPPRKTVPWPQTPSPAVQHQQPRPLKSPSAETAEGVPSDGAKGLSNGPFGHRDFFRREVWGISEKEPSTSARSFERERERESETAFKTI